MPTIMETARILRVSTDTVYRLIRNGKLQAHKRPGVRGMIVTDESLNQIYTKDQLDPKMLTMHEVSHRMGMTPETVRTYIRQDRLIAYRYSTSKRCPYRIDAASVDQLMRDSLVQFDLSP